MTNKLSITGKTEIELSAEKALAIVRDIQFIELYEPKVDSARIKATTEKPAFIRLAVILAGCLGAENSLTN